MLEHAVRSLDAAVVACAGLAVGHTQLVCRCQHQWCASPLLHWRTLHWQLGKFALPAQFPAPCLSLCEACDASQFIFFSTHTSR